MGTSVDILIIFRKPLCPLNSFAIFECASFHLDILKKIQKTENATALKIMNNSLIASIDASWKHVLTLLENFTAKSVASILYLTSETSALSTDSGDIKGVSEDRACVYLNKKSLASTRV